MEQQQPLISVIVPVRNVAVLLYHNIDTLIYQTYKNLEIILINDDSSDSSGVICDKLAKKDPRIKVIHQEHLGVSCARNAGLDIAKGEYIGFMDSDDFISLNYYEFLYNTLINNDADIAECDFVKTEVQKIIFDNFSPPAQDEEELHIYSNDEALKLLHDDNLHTCIKAVAIWNKLYKKSLWDGIRFPEFKEYEDELTTYKVLDKCKKIASSNQVLYAYTQRNTLYQKKNFNMHRFDAIEAYENYLLFFKQKKSPDMLERVSRRYLRMLCIIRDEVSPNKVMILNKENCLKKLDQKFSTIYKYLKVLLEKHPELQDRQHYHQEYYEKYQQIIKYHNEKNKSFWANFQ